MLKDLRSPALNIPAHNIRIMTNDLLSSDPSHHYAGVYHHQQPVVFNQSHLRQHSTQQQNNLKGNEMYQVSELLSKAQTDKHGNLHFGLHSISEKLLKPATMTPHSHQQRVNNAQQLNSQSNISLMTPPTASHHRNELYVDLPTPTEATCRQRVDPNINHQSAAASSQSSHWIHSRLSYLQGEIERFLKDKELLRQLEANEHTKQGQACILLKQEIKARADEVREMIAELKQIKGVVTNN